MVGIAPPRDFPCSPTSAPPKPDGAVRAASDLAAAYAAREFDRLAVADMGTQDDVATRPAFQRTPIRHTESTAIVAPPFVSVPSAASIASSAANTTQPSLSNQTSSEYHSGHSSSATQTHQGIPKRRSDRASRRHDKATQDDASPEKDIPFFGQAQTAQGSPFESPEWMADSHDEVWMEPSPTSRHRQDTAFGRNHPTALRPPVDGSLHAQFSKRDRLVNRGRDSRAPQIVRHTDQGSVFLGFTASPSIPKTIGERSRFRMMFGKGVHLSLAKIRPLQIPVLNYAPYQVDPSGGVRNAKSSSSWSLDPFYFLHNALRYEMRDLYRILYAFYKRAGRLRSRDFRDFSTWWVHYRNFIDVVLSTEGTVLFPWLQKFAVIEGPLSEENRNIMLSNIAGKMVEVERVKAAVYARSGDTIAALITTAADACQALLKFIETVEKELKSYGLEIFMQDPGRLQAEMDVRDTLLNSSAPQVYFPLAIRWFRSSPAYHSWSRQLSDKNSKFCLLVWAERYEASHLRLVMDLTRQ